jgi:hypothetical protein
MPVRTVIENGPKGKRSVAFALDWPGWSRGAKSVELALEVLESYRQRYRPITGLAGVADEFDAAGPIEVVETYVAAMRAYNAGDFEQPMKSWTLPFLIRHSAFHTLDHAWEMEDRDFSTDPP